MRNRALTAPRAPWFLYVRVRVPRIWLPPFLLYLASVEEFLWDAGDLARLFPGRQVRGREFFQWIPTAVRILSFMTGFSCGLRVKSKNDDIRVAIRTL